MKETYPFSQAGTDTVYAFTSIGKKKIQKIVSFLFDYEENGEESYTLLLADLDEQGKLLPLIHASRNGDMDKILATVADIIEYFLLTHPNAVVVFSGTTDSRTRKYRMFLSAELLSRQLFVIDGINFDNSIEAFERNKEYRGFIVSRAKKL